MFDWIYYGGDESPSDIYNAKWVTELDNVLILENGSCYFWYDLHNPEKKVSEECNDDKKCFLSHNDLEEKSL